MIKYFKPAVTKDGRNYQVTRRTAKGYIRDQLPHEGIYTETEMSKIQERESIPGEWLEIPKKNVGFVFGLRQIIGDYTPPSPLEKIVKKIKAYLEKGNGIYNTFPIGGRYFDVRINAAGKLELYHGYESETNTGWIVLENAETSKWHGPHGDNIIVL